MQPEKEKEYKPLINPISVLAIAGTAIFGWGFTYLAVNVFNDYAFGLFIWLPFAMGFAVTLLGSYKPNFNIRQLRADVFLSFGIFCFGLLFFAMEGLICLVMAAPIGFLFAFIGHLIAVRMLKLKVKSTPLTILLLAVSVPALMGFENRYKTEDELLSVVTEIEIAATPKTVWKNAVEFPQLDEPGEFIFNTGIAYPINAKIEGTGVGAIRHCNFSTGTFVEPITAWNEPKLLAFDVVDQPEPMKEISPYDIHPNHLHGYWVSKRGQFELIALENGHTLLRGTTWYINKIKPGAYWSLWSNHIVHKIHERVLIHIKVQSEKR